MKTRLTLIAGCLLLFSACKKDLNAELPVAGKTLQRSVVPGTFSSPDYMIDSIITTYPDNPYGINHVVRTKYFYDAANRISKIFSYSHQTTINSVIGSPVKDTTTYVYYDNRDLQYGSNYFVIKHSTSEDSINYITDWDATYFKDSSGNNSSSIVNWYDEVYPTITITHNYSYPAANDPNPAVYDAETNANGRGSKVLRQYPLLNGNLQYENYSSTGDKAALQRVLSYTYDVTKPNQPADALAINWQLQTYPGAPVPFWSNLTTSVSGASSRDLIGHDVESIGADPLGYYLFYRNILFSYQFDSKGRVAQITETGARDGSVEVIRTRTIKYVHP